MIFKLVNAIMAGLFLISALVQLNDPDPLAWMAVYSLCAVTCLLTFTRYRSWMVPTAVGGLCLLWILSLIPGIYAESSTITWSEVVGSMEMKSMQSELVREAGGLLIAVVWMLVLVVQSRSNK